MVNYSKINTISGWIAFLISLFVYMATIEPTASFWDCGEFIACAYKLQVPHPPGAPLFMLIGRFFSMFASDLEQVAYWVNMVSAVSSAFTILFLFWSITLIGKKLIGVVDNKPNTGQLFALMAAGFVGSLAYTFTDSFWFSAVEAEVYALSSFFTAFVFWAMLKWEEVYDKPEGGRWLLLIAFMVGLSTGVHLLNLVAIPALGFIYYFKKYKPTWKGALATFVISTFILGFILIIVIQKIPDWAGATEILFVNSLGFGFNSGIIFFFLLLVGVITGGIIYSIKKNHHLLNLSLLALVFVLVGYSTYGIIIIRSNFDPVIDENNPENFVKFVSYLKREQYGERPLLKGPQFNSGRPIDFEKGAPKYRKEGDKYVIYDYKYSYKYRDSDKVPFPRMHSTRDDHVRSYKQWLQENTNWKEGRKITGAQNIEYFADRQLGHMYMRYFGWNFIGRDGDDNQRAGYTFGKSNSSLPDSLRSGARNNYYGLPLFLGLIGIFFQILKGRKSFIVTALLFFFTGIAILIYLNNPAFEPRERDYTYVGSFYAFSIWIGLGVLAIYNGLRTGVFIPAGELTTNAIKLPVKLDGKIAAIVGFVIGIIIPGILAAENWDDHDRSNRYFSIDQAKNLLNSCAKNGIIFTGGDNDTFPLWYLQEVEEYRQDVRVCNLSLLNTDWYIDQMKRKAYTSEPLPISFEELEYAEGNNDYAMLSKPADQPDKGTMDVATYIKLVRQNNGQVRQLTDRSLGKYQTTYPTRNLRISFDKSNFLTTEKAFEKSDQQQMLPDEYEPLVQDNITWNVKKTRLEKKHLIMLDMISNIANNGWKRPIYFSVGISRSDYLNLDDYMIMEGMAYRLVPAKLKNSARNEEVINTDVMYDNLMNKFVFRNLDDESIYYSEDYIRMVNSHRLYYYILSDFLIRKQDSTKAKEVINFSLEKMPDKTFPYEPGYISYRTIDLLFKLKEKERGVEMAIVMADRIQAETDYLKSEDYRLNEGDIKRNIEMMQILAGLLKENGEEEKAASYLEWAQSFTLGGRG